MTAVFEAFVVLSLVIYKQMFLDRRFWRKKTRVLRGFFDVGWGEGLKITLRASLRPLGSP